MRSKCVAERTNRDDSTNSSVLAKATTTVGGVCPCPYRTGAVELLSNSASLNAPLESHSVTITSIGGAIRRRLRGLPWLPMAVHHRRSDLAIQSSVDTCMRPPFLLEDVNVPHYVKNPHCNRLCAAAVPRPWHMRPVPLASSWKPSIRPSI